MFGTNKLVATLIGVGSLGAIGAAGAYSAAGLFGSPEKEQKTIKTIADRLEKEGFTVLKDSSKSDWAPVLEDYKSETTKTFLTAETDLAHKAKCKEVLSLDKDNANYVNAKRWCVKKEKMSIILGKAGFKALDASSDSVPNGETESWKEKVEKLRTVVTEPFAEIKKKLKEGEAQVNANIGFLREECKKINIEALQTTNKDFENKFQLMKEWCSIKKTNTD